MPEFIDVPDDSQPHDPDAHEFDDSAEGTIDGQPIISVDGSERQDQ